MVLADFSHQKVLTKHAAVLHIEIYSSRQKNCVLRSTASVYYQKYYKFTIRFSESFCNVYIWVWDTSMNLKMTHEWCSGIM